MSRLTPSPAHAAQHPADAPDQPDLQERMQDRGHFNQYGMRDDPRGQNQIDGENPGTGEGPRQFGSGGDLSSYANVPPADDGQRPVSQVSGPISAVDASGSARALGLDYGGERHKDTPLSSRQGAELIGERDDDRHRGRN